MKILHLSDLHIGKKINDFSLLADQKYVLDQALDLVSEKNIDLVIIAGDIFDVSVPSTDALNLYEYFIYSLIFDKKVKIIAISGNHDSNLRINYESKLKKNIGYYIYGEYSKDLEGLSLFDEYGEIVFYSIPYIRPFQVRRMYEDDRIKTFDDCYKKIIENLDIDTKKRNVCIAHGFVVNEDPKDIESIKENINKDDEYQKIKMLAGLEQVSSSNFSPFIYTALGHIHRSYPVKKNIVYSGSLIKTNFDEEKIKKYFLIVDIGENDVEIERVEVKLLRDMKVIKGKMEDILLNYTYDESFIKIILEDKDPISFPKDKLKHIFPNILKVNYSNLIKEKYNAKIDVDAMSFFDVFSEFYKDKTGNELNEKQKNIVDRVLERIDEKNENS